MMIKNIRNITPSFLSLFILTACAPTVINTSSPIIGANGVAQGNMHISFEQEAVNWNGGSAAIKATAQTSDGELFTGKLVQQNQKTDTSNTSILFDTSKKKNAWDPTFGIDTGDENTVLSAAYAVMIGNRGRSMKCDFQFADASSGIDGGGVGECKISDGKLVPVQF